VFLEPDALMCFANLTLENRVRCRKTGSIRKTTTAFVLATLCLSVPWFNALAQPSNPNPGPANTTAPISAASARPEAQAIESATLTGGLSPDSQQQVLIRVETLLDRAHFSPGVIDGRPGANLHNAIAAYAEAHGLASDGALTAQLFQALASADKAPVTQDYTITADDEKGPFIGNVPDDFAALAKLKHPGYRDSVQELAEKFHMSEALLRALNPDADFSTAGTTILAVRSGNGDLGATVARVEVNKSTNQVSVFDAAGTVVAAFPATVGSRERPAPNGRWAVAFVTFNPSYTYNPKRLTFGDKSRGVLTIAAGPNNPVGTTWIELTKKTYGIHGAPDPSLVGKTASHGCVRLTNWDAATLGHAVKKGTPVVFVGQTGKG
jgi:lipoprotein-anchoring transpeptidase ErfK/SrfK